jgi:uncharacterized protein YecE (DUF72 family)
MISLRHDVRIGVAGWSIPKQHADAFVTAGSHLQRYAARFSAVEINSSFYRSHRPTTYERWAASVPGGFKFAVKLPREITHRRKLVETSDLLLQFSHEVRHLGEKLGPLLVQLPPSLRYDKKTVTAFFAAFREIFDGQIVCEPRHATWFTDVVDRALAAFEVARVASDPACVPRAAEPAGWRGLIYRRLHGSPKMYYSAYAADDIAAVAEDMSLQTGATEQWCIFDNTTLGEATRNALELSSLLA